MIRINLLAADRPTKKKKAAAAPGAVQAYLLLAVFAGAALLLCGGAYLWLTGQIRDLDDKIAKAEQRQRELQAIKKKVDELEAKRSTAKRKVDLIERLQAEQQGPVHMLDEISKALPDFVWLNNLDQTGNSIRFSGQSNSLTSVADFITALQSAGDQCGKPNPLDRTRCWFPDVNLESSTETANIVTYQLSAIFSNPEVAARAAAAARVQPIPGSTAAGTPR